MLTFLAAGAIFVQLLSGALCIDFYITSPYDAISWNLGEKATVTWNILPGGPDIASVNVDLMDGDDYMASVVLNIASGLPPSATSATWEVPRSVAPGKRYFVRVSGPNLVVQRFSHRFAINGQGCSPQSSTSTSSQSVTKSASTTRSSNASTVTLTESLPSPQTSASDVTSITVIPRTSSGSESRSSALTTNYRVLASIVVAVLVVLVN